LALLRKEVARGVAQLQELQPGIERSTGNGVRNALESVGDQMRRELAGQISGFAREIRDAAQQVKGMVTRLTPLWAGLIAAGGLIVGVLLRYVFMASWQRRIEEKIDRLQQAQPLQVQPEALPLSPATGSGDVHPKMHGGHTAGPKPKTQQPDRGTSIRRCMGDTPQVQSRRRSHPNQCPRQQRNSPEQASRLWI